MLVDDMIKQTQVMAENDLTISKSDIVNWFNLGIQRINTKCEMNIPLLNPQATQNVSPKFDARFHEALILFALQKYWESDSSYNEAQYFMRQFDEMVTLMQRDMIVSPSSMYGSDVIQIDVTDSTLMTYPVTVPPSAYYSDIQVYLNDASLTYTQFRLSGRTLTILTPLQVGDRLTVRFEERSDMNQPPNGWWYF